MDQKKIRRGLRTTLTLLATLGPGRAAAQAVPPATGVAPPPTGAATPPGATPAPSGAPPVAPTALPTDSAHPPVPPPPPLPPPPGATDSEAPVILTGPPGSYIGPGTSQPARPAPSMGAVSGPPAAPPLPPCESSGTPSPCVQPADAYRHDGFYLRVGGGPGYGTLFGSGPSGDASVSGLSAGTILAIGGNVADGLVLAGALHGVQVRDTFEGSPPPQRSASAFLGQLGLLMDWFPDPTGGWHVGGLVGLGLLGITDAEIKDASGAGFGGAILGGYDFWIGPQWSAGLFAVASGSTSAELMDRKGNKSGYTLAGWSAGLGYSFTLH